MRKFSLKIRLMLVFSAFSLIIGAVSGFVSWQEAKESAGEFFDTYQMALARNLASVNWQHTTSEIQKQTNKTFKHIKNADEDDEAIGFAVFNQHGTMVFHDNENGRYFAFSNQVGAFFNENVDGEPWRIIRTNSVDGQYVVAVGQELEYRSDLAWDLIEEFMLPWIVGLLVLLLLMLLVIVREFGPLKKVASDIQGRKSEDLSALPISGLPNEVVPLIHSINGLLNKLDGMLQKERRFVADAAHELRTPLTALKVQLEVLEMSADDEKTRQKAADNLSCGLDRAIHLVEQLLALSRLDVSLSNGSQQVEVLDWNVVIGTVCHEYRALADEKNITVNYAINGAGPFAKGNTMLASLLVRNLLENALKYSPEKAGIEIEVADGAFVIVNSHTHVQQEHLAKLGQRFYRPAGQNEKGSGLGLSIVKLIADFYGCELCFANTDKGFLVQVKV